ncbi:MAG: hypothetical protein ACRYE7_02775 [Janthinobacterium lividum]
MFNLRTAKSKYFIIASMIHPKFKGSCVPVLYIDSWDQLFVSECKLINSISEFTEHILSSNNSDAYSDSELFSSVCSPDNTLICGSAT